MRKGSALVWVSVAVLVLCSIVGYSQSMAQNSAPGPNRDVNAVLAAHDKELLAIPVGTMEDGRTPCLKVMLARKNLESERKIPQIIEGYPVVTEITGTVRALGKP